MTEKQIAKYDVTEAAISKLSALYMDLTVSDIEDEAGFAEVELARKVVKGKRVAVEKQRKVFKADALEYGRKVDGEAKKIFTLLEPIETHLTEQGDIVRNEAARIKAEKEAAEKKKIQGRVDAFLKVGAAMDFFDAASMDEAEYESTLGKAERKYEDEQERLKIEAEKKAEADAAAKAAQEKAEAFIEAEKVRLEKWDAEQKAKEAKLRVEQEKVRKAQEETARKQKEAQDKIDADKKAVQDAKDREALKIKLAAEAKVKAEKDAKEAAEKAVQEKINAEIEVQRQIALLPDKEKLQKWIDDIRALPDPALDSPDAKEVWRVASELLYVTLHETEKEIKEL